MWQCLQPLVWRLKASATLWSFKQGAFQKRGSRSKEQQWQRINEEGYHLNNSRKLRKRLNASFPRRRESRHPSLFRVCWIPAFAGMTEGSPPLLRRYEEGVSLRGAQATKQSRSKRLLRFARNDTFSSLGCRHHLGEYLFSGMHPFQTSDKR